MCEKAIEKGLRGVYYVLDHFKAQGMCGKTVAFNPYTLRFVPDRFKTQKMRERAVKDEPETLDFVPDHFKAQEMCDKEVEEDPCVLEFVSDWFATHQQVKIWHDDNDYDDDDDDEIIEWYNGYQKRKTQKAKIKDELMPLAWHPSRWWDWCVPEDEKKRNRKIVFDHLIC